MKNSKGNSLQGFNLTHRLKIIDNWEKLWAGEITFSKDKYPIGCPMPDGQSWSIPRSNIMWTYSTDYIWDYACVYKYTYACNNINVKSGHKFERVVRGIYGCCGTPSASRL